VKIGVLGAGKVGVTLAAKYAAAGHEVLVANSRGVQSVLQILSTITGPVTAATAEQVMQCEVVLLATPWLKVPEVLAQSIFWDGRILVDTTNIFTSYKHDLVVADLKGDYGSEIVARLAPDAHVVKAFNTLPFDVMFAPTPASMKRVLFIAGDDDSAVKTVADLVAQIGLQPVFAGQLAIAGRQMELGGPFSQLELFSIAAEVSV
jgi:predicted dinucleotide-binding enzyme